MIAAPQAACAAGVPAGHRRVPDSILLNHS